MIEAWLSASEMIASFSVQQRLEQAAVGVEAGSVEDGVFGAEEVGDGLFQLLVQVLCAADEAHAGHAEAVGVQRVLGGGDHVRVVGQAQVVVGAEVQHRAAIGKGDLGGLRRGDDALGLEQAGGADLVEGVGVACGERHAGSLVARGGGGCPRATRREYVHVGSSATSMSPKVARGQPPPPRASRPSVNSSSTPPCPPCPIPSARSPSGSRRSATGGSAPCPAGNRTAPTGSSCTRSRTCAGHRCPAGSGP